MTEPAAASQCTVAGEGRSDRLPSPAATWFHTRDGRRFGCEIGVVVVVKLALLVVLWFVFIEPWPRPGPAPAVVVQQLYAPSAPTLRHD
ncbi:MAG: cytochrome oxidase putative small subunit CydP [Betaproteobacteria bacterium]